MSLHEKVTCLTVLLASFVPIHTEAQDNLSGIEAFENLSREDAAVTVSALVDHMEVLRASPKLTHPLPSIPKQNAPLRMPR